MADRVGRQLGSYRLTKLLGRGSFADVYLAEHIHLGTLGAMKVLNIPLDQIDAQSLDEFRAEARTLAQLKHPHIVPMLDFGIDNNEPFLVMEYAEQGSMRKRHPGGTPLPLATVVSYVNQVAAGLQYAHDQRVIHRDIKPENIVVGSQNQLLLGDFGIAVKLQTMKSHVTASASGTALYMAPEQIEDQPRPASDQYALAVVAYEWLTGTPPFVGSQKEVLNKHLVVPPPSLHQKVPTIPLAVEQVVLKALAKDPKDRYPSVQAFASALEQASEGVGSSPSGGSAPTPDPTQGAYQPPYQPYQPPYQPYGAQVAAGPGAIPPTIKVPDTFPVPVSQKSWGDRGKRFLKTVLIGVGTIILIVVACNIWNAFTKIGPYSATVPGPGCAHGTAEWLVDTGAGNVHCTATGMTLTQLSNAKRIASVFFAQSGHSFSSDYAITVDIGGLTYDTCAGVETHQNGNFGGYGLYVCSDGFWFITRYAGSSGNPTDLSSGNVASSDTYHVKVIAQGNTQGISINNGALNTITDSTFTNTEYIALIVTASNGGEATFSNFVFTPM